MRQQYTLISLLLLFISGYQAQDATATLIPPDWKGDPSICTDDPSIPFPPGPTMPTFLTRAEYAVERLEILHLPDLTLTRGITLSEYIYDSDNNKLIVVNNTNGFIDVEYYYYDIAKKSTYYRGEICIVTNISINNVMDGTSAILFLDGTTHIRPMNEFLLFSNEDSNRPQIRPRYAGSDTIRGIPVEKWQTCVVDKTNYETFLRTWAFARRNFSISAGIVGDVAVPVQGIINGTKLYRNGTNEYKIDEVLNVYAFRAGISETTDALSPPKGVFCDSGKNQNLLSLSDVGITWPNRFSVRVESSTSRTHRWQRFHLHYDNGREDTSRRIRYDYMPPGAEDFESVIHDYTDNLTFIIDRRIGTCKIRSGVDIPDVSPIRDPITFFIKNEANFIFSPREKAWEFNGFRKCRGDTIKCTILTSGIENFPAIVESDTGEPTGETWTGTSVEYGWSVRSPPSNSSNATRRFDYPVSLFLRLYRFADPTNPSYFGLRTEDIEYEFYEMSHGLQPYDFDTSICYRALNYEYLHLVFTLRLNRGNIADGNHLDRRRLERQIHYNLTRTMNVKTSRITNLEIDHERVSNDVTVFFTVLGQTPRPGTSTGVAGDEPTAETARDDLQKALDRGDYQFDHNLPDDTVVQFKGVSGSLKFSKQYMSTHTGGRKVVKESYTGGSLAGAIIGGILVGLFVGIIIAAVIRVVRKEPMPAFPTSVANPLPSINFHTKKSAGAPSNSSTSATSDA